MMPNDVSRVAPQKLNTAVSLRSCVIVSLLKSRDQENDKRVALFKLPGQYDVRAADTGDSFLFASLNNPDQAERRLYSTHVPVPD